MKIIIGHSLAQQELECFDEVVRDLPAALPVLVNQLQPVFGLQDIGCDQVMGMLMEKADPDRSFLLGKLEVPPKIIDILANLAFRSHINRNRIFNLVRTFFGKHHFEDVSRQKHSNFLFFVIDLAFKQKDEWAYRILSDDKRNRDFYLLVGGKAFLLELLSFDFILVGIDDLSLQFCESPFGIVGDMDEEGYLIGRVEASDDTHLDSISLIEQFLVPEARSFKSYPEFFSQSLIVRVPFNTISFVIENFHFIQILSGNFQRFLLFQRQQWRS